MLAPIPMTKPWGRGHRGSGRTGSRSRRPDRHGWRPTGGASAEEDAAYAETRREESRRAPRSSVPSAGLRRTARSRALREASRADRLLARELRRLPAGPHLTVPLRRDPPRSPRARGGALERVGSSARGTPTTRSSAWCGSPSRISIPPANALVEIGRSAAVKKRPWRRTGGPAAVGLSRSSRRPQCVSPPDLGGEGPVEASGSSPAGGLERSTRSFAARSAHPFPGRLEESRARRDRRAHAQPSGAPAGSSPTSRGRPAPRASRRRQRWRRGVGSIVEEFRGAFDVVLDERPSGEGVPPRPTGGRVRGARSCGLPR